MDIIFCWEINIQVPLGQFSKLTFPPFRETLRENELKREH